MLKLVSEYYLSLADRVTDCSMGLDLHIFIDYVVCLVGDVSVKWCVYYLLCVLRLSLSMYCHIWIYIDRLCRSTYFKFCGEAARAGETSPTKDIQCCD